MLEDEAVWFMTLLLSIITTDVINRIGAYHDICHNYPGASLLYTGNKVSENYIDPIDDDRKSEVVLYTEQYIHRAERQYQCHLPMIPVKFDLKGRSSGMYVRHAKERFFRFNPYLFAKYYQDALNITIPHEVAHYVTDVLYGLKRIKPHGQEWKNVMTGFGVEPRASGRYDLTGIPVRRQQRFQYSCACRVHQVSTSRHNKMQSGKMTYICRHCGDPISPLD